MFATTTLHAPKLEKKANTREEAGLELLGA